MYSENYKVPDNDGRIIDYEKILQKQGLGIVEPGQEVIEIDIDIRATGIAALPDQVDRTEESMPEVAAAVLEQAEIERMLQPLDEHERNILRLRFGLDISRPRTAEEVGGVLSIDRDEVRRIEARAMSMLRAFDRQEGAK